MFDVLCMQWKWFFQRCVSCVPYIWYSLRSYKPLYETLVGSSISLSICYSYWILDPNPSQPTLSKHYQSLYNIIHDPYSVYTVLHSHNNYFMPSFSLFWSNFRFLKNSFKFCYFCIILLSFRSNAKLLWYQIWFFSFVLIENFNLLLILVFWLGCQSSPSPYSWVNNILIF